MCSPLAIPFPRSREYYPLVIQALEKGQDLSMAACLISVPQGVHGGPALSLHVILCLPGSWEVKPGILVSGRSKTELSALSLYKTPVELIGQASCLFWSEAQGPITVLTAEGSQGNTWGIAQSVSSVMATVFKALRLSLIILLCCFLEPLDEL